MKFNNETCRCRRCGADLTNKKATYDGEFIYCNDRCYVWSKELKKVKVENSNVDLTNLKNEVIVKLEVSNKSNYKYEYVKDNCRFYYNDFKLDSDESFRNIAKLMIIESDRIVEISIRFLGGDTYGDRVFTCGYYYKYQVYKYFVDHSKEVAAIYYKHDKYKDIIEEYVKYYIKNVNPQFNPRKIDAIRFNENKKWI